MVLRSEALNTTMDQTRPFARVTLDKAAAEPLADVLFETTRGNALFVTEALRDLARWLYRRLESEFEYLTSEQAVDEAITANGYTFVENGKPFG